jgi:hypothetical protein
MTEDAWKIEAMKASMKNRSTFVSLVHPLLLNNAREKDAQRDTEHFHPSDLCKRDWCVRQSAYKMLGHVESNPEKPKPFKTLNIFAEGNRIHEKWQGWLRDVGVLRGRWFCEECSEMWYGTYPCEYCGSRKVVYQEVPLHDEEHRLLGHADGHVVLEDDYLIEIKSVGIGTFRYEDMGLFNRYSRKEITAEEMWNEVRRPFLSHLKQGNLYMYVTDIRKMIFIYEWKAGQDIREFKVNYQPELISGILTACANALKQIDNNELPDRPEWIESKDTPPCRWCAYKTTCWSDTDDEAEGSGKVRSEVRLSGEAGGRDAGPPSGTGRVVRR